MKRTQIMALAAELNDLMGLEPPIITAASKAEMTEKITVALQLLVESDSLTIRSVMTLEDMGLLTDLREGIASKYGKLPDEN